MAMLIGMIIYFMFCGRSVYTPGAQVQGQWLYTLVAQSTFFEKR